MPSPPYLDRIFLKDDVNIDDREFPFNLPFVKELDLTFDSEVCFLVGENGSGKSTVIEAIAQLCRLPVGGGGKNDLAGGNSPHKESELAPALLGSFFKKPKDGYFFRAEFQAHFASLLDEPANDPDFLRNPYSRYGGSSLHEKPHGEAFLSVFQSWMKAGMILMDEPESALSPQRQLTLLGMISALVQQGGTQLIIATHSPILLTFPGASIFNFVDGDLKKVTLEETEHYQITKDILNNPNTYWRHLGTPS